MQDILNSTKIFKNTNLIEVLAEEFDQRDLHKTIDKHGFQYITGLDSKSKTKSSSQFSKVETNRSENRGLELKKSICPGVSMRQMKPGNNFKKRANDTDFLSVTGGVFQPQSQQGKYGMSMTEYAKLSGSRHYMTSWATNDEKTFSSISRMNTSTGRSPNSKKDSIKDSRVRAFCINDTSKMHDEMSVVS